MNAIDVVLTGSAVDRFFAVLASDQNVLFTARLCIEERRWRKGWEDR